jgi:hypothetical protein
LRKLVTSKAARMMTKYFLKHKLHFQYDPIFGNLEKISSIRLKIINYRFELHFKPIKKDYKKTMLILNEKKRLVRLERKKLEEEEIYIPPIQVSFLKAIYVIHFETVLAVMGINTLK